jgi:retron-type reverse transcriptase
MPPPRHDGLFDRIASFQALLAACARAVRGKRQKPGAAAFMANLEPNLLRLERTLLDGTWKPGRYVEIELFDPKHRIVSAAPFRDRVVHHALCAVVEPIFERGFIAHSFANRAGKGTHRGIAAFERYRDRHRFVLRCDIWRYFPAIDHAILKRDLRRRIACPRTLEVLDRIVDGSNPQEPVNLYFPGDDLFGPFDRRRGLPIGNLTSQFFGNVYLDGLDHFATEVLHAPWVRYVDDFALFADDRATLERWQAAIARYLARRRLVLHPRKTFIAATAEPARFLGFELLPGGRRRLPGENVDRFRGRLRSLRDRWRHGRTEKEDVDRRIGAWVAHARHADTWRLRAAIFRDGWFDPSGEPSRGPCRSPVAACCAAVPGTTIRGTPAPPTATGTPPGTTTTTSGSASPARPAA